MGDGGYALHFLNEGMADGDYALYFLNGGVDEWAVHSFTEKAKCGIPRPLR